MDPNTQQELFRRLGLLENESERDVNLVCDEGSLEKSSK